MMRTHHPPPPTRKRNSLETRYSPASRSCAVGSLRDNWAAAAAARRGRCLVLGSVVWWRPLPLPKCDLIVKGGGSRRWEKHAWLDMQVRPCGRNGKRELGLVPHSPSRFSALDEHAYQTYNTIMRGYSKGEKRNTPKLLKTPQSSEFVRKASSLSKPPRFQSIRFLSFGM